MFTKDRIDAFLHRRVVFAVGDLYRIGTDQNVLVGRWDQSAAFRVGFLFFAQFGIDRHRRLRKRGGHGLIEDAVGSFAGVDAEKLVLGHLSNRIAVDPGCIDDHLGIEGASVGVDSEDLMVFYVHE